MSSCDDIRAALDEIDELRVELKRWRRLACVAMAEESWWIGRAGCDGPRHALAAIGAALQAEGP